MHVEDYNPDDGWLVILMHVEDYNPDDGWCAGHIPDGRGPQPRGGRQPSGPIQSCETHSLTTKILLKNNGQTRGI